MNALEIIMVTLSGWLIAAFGWIKWWYEIREKRLERAAKEKAEASLLEIKRRAPDSSPYFILSEERFNSLLVPADEPGQRLSFSPGLPFLLSYMHHEVDRNLPVGKFIYLLVENHGSTAFEVTVEFDGNPAPLLTVEADRSFQFNAIRYSYVPQNHGRDETIKVRFLAANGWRDTHRYLTRHGFRTLKRTYPT